jgi:uncharacterized protein (TIGR03067 family)
MRVIALLLALPLLTLPAAAQESSDPVRKEILRFRGTWNIIRFDLPEGEKVADPVLRESKVEFTDEEMHILAGGSTIRFTYKIDPKKTPPAIDATVAGVPKKDGQVAQGIYTFEGNTLTICLGKPDSGRPAEFRSLRESESIVLVLKRR